MKLGLIFSLFITVVTLIACGSNGGSSGNKAPISSISSSASSISSSLSSSSVSSASYRDFNTSPKPADTSGMNKNAKALAASIRLGWNIGNTMEAIGGETAWGNPEVTPALLKLVKDSGFDAVRIPVAWDQYADPVTGEISVEWLDRVKTVVQAAIDEDLYVLINIHWDGGWLERNVTKEKQASVNAKQKAYWSQIATHLRDFDERLLFAGANEPDVETAEQMQVLDAHYQTFVDAVRETGGRNAYRVLVLQGPVTDIEKTNTLWNALPNDTVADRLMAEVHFYTPYNFALMDEDQSWGKQFYYWGEGYHSQTDLQRNPTWGEEEKVDELFAIMKQKFVDQNIPVILGEYSAMRRINLTGDDLSLHLNSRAYYHEYVTRKALENGLIPFYWDNGGTGNHASGIFDRTTNQVFDTKVLQALQDGSAE